MVRSFPFPLKKKGDSKATPGAGGKKAVMGERAPGIVFVSTRSFKEKQLLYSAPITGLVLHIAQFYYFTCCASNRHICMHACTM